MKEENAKYYKRMPEIERLHSYDVFSKYNKIQFRPYPFWGLVFLDFDKLGWWHFDKSGYKHQSHFSITTTKYKKFFRISLILLWFRISYARLNK